MDMNEFFDGYYEVLIDSAVKKFQEFGEIDELIELFSSSKSREAVQKNNEAVKIIVSHLRGEQQKKKKSIHKRAELRRLGNLAWLYHGAGLPKHNNPEISKSLSACRKVGLMKNVSESKVRKGMECSNLSEIMFEFGRTLSLDGVNELIASEADIEVEALKYSMKAFEISHPEIISAISKTINNLKEKYSNYPSKKLKQ